MEFSVEHILFLYLFWVWAILSVFFWWKCPVSMSRSGRIIVGVIHLLVLFLLSCALADISIVFRETAQLSYKVVLVLDQSASVSPNAIQSSMTEVESLLNKLSGNKDISVDALLFNSQFKVISPADAPSIVRNLGSIAATKDASDISLAITRAVNLVPQDAKGSIIVITDGVNTGSSLRGAVSQAAARKIPVHLRLVKQNPRDPFAIEKLKLPSEVYVNERYPIEVLVYSQFAGEAEISLYCDDRRLALERVNLNAGITSWTSNSLETTAGQHKYRVTVRLLSGGTDMYEENNTHIGAVLAKTVPRVLIVTPQPKRIQGFVRTLELSGVRTKISAPADFPFSIASLLQYSAVIFENVPATSLSLRQLKYVKSYVKDYGGGFLMTGGSDSFGSGGYSDSDIEDISPVLMSPQTYSSSFGLILLLDSSGSMKGYPIDWVKRAAKQIVWLMRGRYLGIYHFDQLPHVAVPLQKVERNRLKVDQDIDSIQASGATAFCEALRLAARHLDERGFSSKHVILLSDGNPSDVMLLKPLYPFLQQAGIKVSTIGIGHQVNNLVLKEIAQKCSGEFYHSTEFDRIPEIFEQEIIRVIGPPFVEEKTKPVLTVKDGNLKDVASGVFPHLIGYAGTTLKDGAVAELLSHRNDVLYSHWQCGLGKTAVFTSTAGYGKWASSWASWGEASAFWGGVVKSILRSRTSDYQLNMKTAGSESHVFIDAIDSEGNYINDAKLTLWVVPPGTSKAVPYKVRQVDQGLYFVSFTMKQQGFYSLSVSKETQTGRKEEVASSTIALASAVEYSSQQTSIEALSSILGSSGGGVISSLGELSLLDSYRSRLVQSMSFYRLWQWFALIAFLLYVLELSLRRLNVFAPVEGDGSTQEETAKYKRIADNFMKMARDLDKAGDEEEAQKYYLKARSFYLKAEHNDKAARMWERYRHLDHSRKA